VGFLKQGWISFRSFVVVGFLEQRCPSFRDFVVGFLEQGWPSFLRFRGCGFSRTGFVISCEAECNKLP
jgi:hypothetical protein